MRRTFAAKVISGWAPMSAHEVAPAAGGLLTPDPVVSELLSMMDNVSKPVLDKCHSII